MSKTRIFLSSTCYDLAPVREDLREHLIELGHEPLLSEYPSFLVGGRRGSLDDSSGKSITNLEYESARQFDIPCFVFVNRSVDTLRHIWKKNPGTDFSPTVDSPEVFEFIERIHDENHWTFTFEKTREIKDILTIQLSSLMRELIDRSRNGKLSPVLAFENESPEAQRLARDKPKYWEFLLASELLDSKLQKVQKRYDAVTAGRSYRLSQTFPDFHTFIIWVEAKLADISSIIEAIQLQLPLIADSFGPPGVSGNAQEIKHRIDEFILICHALTDWEEEVICSHAPDECKALKDTMRGWTSQCLEEIKRIPIETKKPFLGKITAKGTISVNLVFTDPDFAPFHKEVNKLKRRKNWGF